MYLRHRAQLNRYDLAALYYISVFRIILYLMKVLKTHKVYVFFEVGLSFYPYSTFSYIK